MIHAIKFVSNFRKRNEYSLEKVYPDGMYVTGYEDEVGKDSQQQTMVQNIGDFLRTFFSLAGFNMQDASITTRMNFLEQDAYKKALQRRLPSQMKARQVPQIGNISVVGRSSFLFFFCKRTKKKNKQNKLIFFLLQMNNNVTINVLIKNPLSKRITDEHVLILLKTPTSSYR
jgi:hypothetical protein